MSEAKAVQEGLDAAIIGDATIMAVLDEVYAGFADPDAPLPYVVTSERTEVDDSTHSDDGADSTVNLHIWASTEGQVLTIYGHLKRILHRQAITVSGHRYIVGTIELVTTFRDPEKAVMHGVARYRIQTEEQ